MLPQANQIGCVGAVHTLKDVSAKIKVDCECFFPITVNSAVKISTCFTDTNTFLQHSIP